MASAQDALMDEIDALNEDEEDSDVEIVAM